MSLTDCIKHLASQKICVVREDYLTIADGNHCAAALLNFFEFNHKWKLANKKQSEKHNNIVSDSTHYEGLLQWQTYAELTDGLLGQWKTNSIRNAINLLELKRFVSIYENPNKRFSFDNTKFFLFEVDNVQDAINELENLSTVKKERPSNDINLSTVKKERPSNDINLSTVKKERPSFQNVGTTKNTYKEDLTKNTSNNNNIVETSSTAFEREKLEDDPSKWEWTDQDQTATSYGKNQFPDANKMVESISQSFVEIQKTVLNHVENGGQIWLNEAATKEVERLVAEKLIKLKVENETNAIEAVDSAIETEAIQTDNYTKKDAPQPLKSEPTTAHVNDSNSKNEGNTQTTQPMTPKREINECLQHDSSESVLYCEVELIEEKKVKKPKGPAPTEFDTQVNDSLCQLFESWGYKTFKRDANQIRLMRTEDKRAENEIVFLLNYLQKFGDADKKLRWVEIRSPKSFREKADSLIAEIKRNQANENRNQPKYSPDPNICPF